MRVSHPPGLETHHVVGGLIDLAADRPTLAQRLQQICTDALALCAEDIQAIACDVTCPPTLRPPARVADGLCAVAAELVRNAIVHGMHVRLRGQVKVEVAAERGGGLTLRVSDDGWGCPCPVVAGAGLARVAALLREMGGTLSVTAAPRTTFAIRLPAPSLRARALQ